MSLLETGVEILQWNTSLQNTPKNRALVNAARKLLANAQQSQQSNPEPTFSFSPLWQDFVNTGNLSFDFNTQHASMQAQQHSAQQSQQQQQQQVLQQQQQQPAPVALSPWGDLVSSSDGAGMQLDGGMETFFANLLDPSPVSNPYSSQYGQYSQ